MSGHRPKYRDPWTSKQLTFDGTTVQFIYEQEVMDCIGKARKKRSKYSSEMMLDGKRFWVHIMLVSSPSIRSLLPVVWFANQLITLNLWMHYKRQGQLWWSDERSIIDGQQVKVRVECYSASELSNIEIVSNAHSQPVPWTIPGCEMPQHIPKVYDIKVDPTLLRLC